MRKIAPALGSGTNKSPSGPIALPKLGVRPFTRRFTTTCCLCRFCWSDLAFAIELSGRVSFLHDEVIIGRTNPATAKVLVIRFIKEKLNGEKIEVLVFSD